MGEKSPRILPKVATFVFFYMPKFYDIIPKALLPLRRRGSKAEKYFARKLRRLRPGLNSRNLLPKATEAAEIIIGNAYYLCHVTEHKFGSLSQQISNYNCTRVGT